MNKEFKIVRFHSALKDNNSELNDVTNSFLKSIEKDDITFDPNSDKKEIFFLESGGSEMYFKSEYLNYSAPFYLLTYGKNNSLASALEILSFLQSKGIEGHILYGTTDSIHDELLNIDNRNNNSKEFDNLGVIGTPSDWLISSCVDYYLIKEKLNFKMIDISIDEFLDIYEHEDYSFSSPYKGSIILKSNSNNELNKAIRVYNTLKTIVKKYNLKGITIRCFDLLSKIKTTSCLALAMLNSDGIVSTCEGDILSFLSMYYVYKKFDLISFQANPSKIDLANNEMVLAHCTVPLSMCSSFKFDTHFESGVGIGIKGELEENDITLFKLKKDLSGLITYEGKITKNLNYCDLCRTQIDVVFDRDISNLIKNPIGNHQLVCYGKHSEEFTKSFK